MKFRVTFKDPDGVYVSVNDAARSYVDDMDLDEDDYDYIRDIQMDRLNEFISSWVDYSEYVTIEFDTEENTAKVVKNK